MVSPDSNGLDHAVETVHESTPLLAVPTNSSLSNGQIPSANDDPTAPSSNEQNDWKEDERSMPYVQVLVICYASLADPVAFFAVLPFINEMIQRIGNLDEADVGFWSGMIESLFSVLQMTLVFSYGRMSDRVGRKPVLVFSLVGLGIATALFGLSQTLWQMILLRLFAGFFGGTIVATRTMLAENTTKATQGRAFSWYMFTRNTGGFVGPLLGGGLANPADQFPNVFGRIAFFENYPYALPMFVSGALCLSGALLCSYFLKETLIHEDKNSDQANAPTSTWYVLCAPGVGLILYVVGHVAFLGISYTTVTPVFLFVTPQSGGCGLSTSQSSYFLAISGISQAAWILLLFPPLQRAVGTGNVLRICGVIWPLFMAMFPIVSELFRLELQTWPWIVAIPALILGSSGAMSFASTQLCVNDISPSPAVLGTVNALALVIASATRAVAPALSNSIFALGVKIGWAHGHLVWFFLILLAVAQNVPLYFLPTAVEGRIKNHQPPPNAEQSIPDNGSVS